MFCYTELYVGKPMAIQQHADVIAVSYEARAMGVTKHMPTNTIRQRYPSVKLVHVEVSGQWTPLVSAGSTPNSRGMVFLQVCLWIDGSY